MRDSKRSTAVLVLTAVAACVLLLGLPGPAGASIVKRSFVRLGCMGQYDKSDFASLDRICEECYNLYREPGLHGQCRSFCFKNEYFTGCVKALLLDDKQPEIDVMVNKLYGGS